MKITNYHIFYRYAKPEILDWAEKVRSKLKQLESTEKDPELVVILGGDGAILEAARTFTSSILLGLNFGTKGFLTSARDEKEYHQAIEQILSGEFNISERKMIDVAVQRDGQTVFQACGLNEAVISSPVGVVKLAVAIDDSHYQNVNGTGVMVSTATGSTAYNLSAHGPIVLPDLPAMILTELLDHDIPTPSLVLPSPKTVEVTVEEFRDSGRLQIAKTGEPADVVVDVDGANLCALKVGDAVSVTESDRTTKLVELEAGHFLKTIRDRFSFN